MPSLQRIAGLDLLRGIAILLVLIHHLAIRLPLHESQLADYLPKRLLTGLGFNGYEAVFVFFVISGFLITHHSLSRWGSLQALDWRAFYWRRAARILPLLLILLILLSALHLLHLDDYLIDGKQQSLAGALFSALGLHLNWYEGQTGYLPASWDVLWSLSIEEAFYLGFPLLCLLLPKRLLPISLIALALSLPWSKAALANATDIWQEKAYLPGMAAIASGVLAAMLAQRWQPSRRFSQCLGLAGALGLLNVLFFGDLLWRVLAPANMLVLTGSATCLVLSAYWLRDGRHHWPWGLAAIQSMGRLSYEIYLSHMFIQLSLLTLYWQLGGDKAWGWLCFIPCILLCWGLGWLIERLISKPCARWLLTQTPQSAGGLFATASRT